MLVAVGRIVLAVSALGFWIEAWAQERNPLAPEPNTLFMRVIDTGPGTATLTVVTGETSRDKHVMIYDVGHWNDDPLIIDELNHYLGRRKTIDLLVVSHSDSDHLGAADSVLKFWKVKKSVRTGWERDKSTGTYWSYRRALKGSVASEGTEDFVIGDGNPALGEEWSLGPAKVVFLSGFSKLPGDWDVGVPPGNSRYESKARNAVSIVVRVDYFGKSLLLPGDAVGRVDDAPPAQLIGAEKFLLDNAARRPVRADILLAPHHGADNASSMPFIDAVRPSWVIFSSGAMHEHPKLKTAQRYQRAGVRAERMMRTDVGDKKRRKEWSGRWSASCEDGHGDDGISILVRKSGQIIVLQDPPVDPSKGC